MAGLYGDFAAKYVSQGRVNLDKNTWTALIAGSSILSGRRHIRIFPKSKPGNAIALEYVNINSDGTFTTPTTLVKNTTIYPGNAKITEPVTDKVQIYGRLVNKIGSTDNSLVVIVTEYK